MTQSTAASGSVESTLVEKMRAGDRSAFSALVEAHQARIVAYCLRFLGSKARAEDAAQEVFLTVWKERQRYQDRGHFDRYLLTIARHRCLALDKKQRSGRALLSRYAEVQDLTNAESDAQPMARSELELALAKLGAKHRDVIVLRYLEGLSLAEIGEVTGLRAGTIKSRLSRGVASLRKELSQ